MISAAPSPTLAMLYPFIQFRLDYPLEQKRQLVEPKHKQISLQRLCHLLGLNRAGLYYQAVAESAENLQLMYMLDE